MSFSVTRAVLLYRQSEMAKGELEAATRAGFFCTTSRMHIRPGDLVVSRYSALPFYKEQEADITIAGGRIINSIYQHAYVADMRNWVEDLQDLTPKTWFRLEDIPEQGPFVLKGQTNSRKEHWNTHMFAKDRVEAFAVADRLMMDGFIGHGGQDVYVRQYVPLVTYGHGLNGLPVTEEHRFFVCRGKILSSGYYWASWGDTIHESDPTWAPPSPSDVPKEFLREVITRVGRKSDFYAVDVARTQAGNWMVVELNEGQMSGPSDNDLVVLYCNLYQTIQTEEW